jgi:hypothetical protein
MQTARSAVGSRPAPRSRTGLLVLAKESRIGMKPVPIPKGVNVELAGQSLKVKVRPMPTLLE